VIILSIVDIFTVWYYMHMLYIDGNYLGYCSCFL